MKVSTGSTCPQCGSSHADAVAAGLCMVCLFDDLLGETGADPNEEGMPLNRLGEYTLVAEMARGGMGIIYRAKQIQPAREVALKVLPGASLLSEEARLRFRLEARAMAALDHPHLLPVYGFGENEGAAWLAMKLVTGGTLAVRRELYVGKYREIAAILATIAEAIHHAHSRGILHRDLKPANILFDDRDSLYVADFGLARLLDEESRLTKPLSLMGTPQYLAPEAMDGKHQLAGTSVDIWSLGVILYELLAGRLPYEGSSSLEVMRLMVEDGMPSLPREVPHDLRVITAYCLQCAPEKRYPAALDFAADLRHWLADEPILARQETVSEKLARTIRRNPVAAGLAGLCALGGLGAAIMIWRANTQLTASLATAQEARDAARASSEDRRLNLYAADLASAQLAMQGSNTERTRHLLANYLPREGESDLRGWAWHWLDRASRGDARRKIPGPGGQLQQLAFHSDGALIASSINGHLYSIPLANGAHQILASLPSHCSPLDILPQPDGSIILGCVKDGAWSCRPGSTTPPQQLVPQRSMWWATSPDGQWLGCADRFKNYDDPGAGTVLHSMTSGTSQKIGPVGNWGLFSPDSTELICGLQDGHFHALSLQPFGEKKRRLDGDGHASKNCRGLAFSPDGKRLVAGLSEATALLWEWPSGRLLHQQRIFNTKGAWRPRFSPDGRWLAFAGDSQQIAIVHALDLSPKRILHGHQSEVQSVLFSPDATKLYSTARDGSITEWPLDLENTHFPTPPLINGRPIFRGDSKMVAIGDKERPVQLWDPQTWKKLDYKLGTGFPVKFTDHDRTLIITNLYYAIGWWDWQQEKRIKIVYLETKPGDRGWLTAMSPDDRWMAGGTFAGHVIIWDTATGKQYIVLRGLAADVHGLHFSPDGRYLIGCGGDRSPRIWSTSDWSLTHVLERHGHVFSGAAFSPDGRTLVTTCVDGLARFFDLTTGLLIRTFKGDTTGLVSPLFLPDGHSIAFLQSNKSVLILDMRTWRETVRLPAVFKASTHPDFLTLSPDGTQLIGNDWEQRAIGEWRIDKAP